MCRPALLLSFALLTACAEFPELDATVTEEMRSADYPNLAPLSELQNTPEPRITETGIADLSTRIARLRARAARLSGPVIDAATKARMKRRPRIR